MLSLATASPGGAEGWLDPEQLRDRRAAADAVIEFTNAALSLRLRPSM